jgi:hypothetical protein
MKVIPHDQDLVAYCGLYCGACPRYLRDNCPGCKKNEKAAWCKIRTCCMEKKIKSCADCNFDDVNECNKFNNFMSKLFSFIFRSNRKGCIEAIRKNGYADYTTDMVKKKQVSIKR